MRLDPALSLVTSANLVPPSGYTIIDLTPTLPAGHTADGDVINDSRQAVFHIRNQTTGSTTYHLWEKGVTSVYGTDVRVFEINNAGQAVGWNEVPEATLWNGTTPTSLAGLGSRAFDITESGLITGEHVTEEAVQPFLWQDGVFTDLGNPPGALFTQGRDVNEAGQVIGRLAQADPLVQLGFFWSEGAFTTVTPPTNDFTGVSMGSSVGEDNLNDAGEFVGVLSRIGGARGFFWSDGVMTLIPTLGGDVSIARELNQAGQVVGTAQNPSGFGRAFVWAAGEMTELGTLGGSTSAGVRINERGQIAGQSATASGEIHAFVWSDGVLTDLGTLGGSTSSVRDINENGDIVGTAETSDGEMHAVVWRRNTPGEQVETVTELVEELLLEGVLTQEQADGLTAKLDGVIGKIEGRQTEAAIHQLGAFIRQVQAFMNNGTLSEEDGRILTDAAESIIDDLTP